MSLVRLLSLCFILITGLACSQCVCVDGEIALNFVGFEQSEADTIVLKKFVKNTAFAQQIDSSHFKEGDYRMAQKGDTITFPSRVGTFSLEEGFDL